MTKLKNTNCNNSKTPIVTKLNNLILTTHKLKLSQISENTIVKKMQKLNCQKAIKTQIVKKKKIENWNCDKLKNSNCD